MNDQAGGFPRCPHYACGADWHGLALGHCPGSDAQGPIEFRPDWERRRRSRLAGTSVG